MDNLQGEMSRLLEWASVGEDSSQGEHAARTHAQRRSRLDPSRSAMERHEEVRDSLERRADIHQKRAKRRELVESTAVKLPRESQATGPRRRTQREVSYWSDNRQAPLDPASVPASMIPDAFRILLESPFPHAEPQFYGMFGEDADWTHNPLTRQWERVVFPSKVPAGRRDVQLLHAWVNDMVSRLKRTAGSLPEESVLKEAQVPRANSGPAPPPFPVRSAPPPPWTLSPPRSSSTLRASSPAPHRRRHAPLCVAASRCSSRSPSTR